MIEFSDSPVLAYIELPVSPELCWVISMALLHTLWQGTLLACLVALLVKLRLPRSVHQRFIICFTVLLLISLSPFANAYWISQSKARPTSIATATQEFKIHGRLPLFKIQELALQNQKPVENESNDTTNSTTDVGETKPSASAAATTLEPNSASRSTIAATTARRHWAHWSILLSVLGTFAYAAGAMFMILRLMFGLRRQRRFSKSAQALLDLAKVPGSIIQSAEQAARKLGKRLNVSLAMFNGRGSAMVTGILQPIILVNASLASGLTPIQLEQILAHELVHVYRRDPLTQLIQRLIESLLFFHPGVWYVSRQVSDLREMCVDHWVARSYSNVDYAMALLECAELEQLAVEQHNAGLTLSAVGNRSSQLATRIQMLLAYENQRTEADRLGSSPATKIALVAVALLVSCLSIAFFKQSFPNEGQSAKSPAPLVIGGSSTVQFIDAEWEWIIPSRDQLNPSKFLFGGTEVTLADSLPEDIEVVAMVNPEDFKFGQWHYGDTSSTRVAILAKTDGSNLQRLFVDSNRNRKIEDNEEVTTTTSNGKTWLAILPTEVRDNLATIHAKRQVGITPKLSAGKLRVTTIGYCEGTVKLGDKKISVRRVDQDGNGLPTDNADQIWFDLDQDGEFDLISERMNVNSFLKLGDTRYSLFSDRLGQSLKVTKATDVGKVKFRFAANDRNATVQRLEGCLRDESGMTIAIKLTDEAATVPAGRYCIANLLLEIRDKDDSVWRVTLTRGIGTGYFEVEANEQHEIQLLESLKFSFTPQQISESHSGHSTQLRPYLYTPNGLVVTNFVCENPDSQADPRDGSVVANFDIKGTVDRNNRSLQGRSCYG